MKSRAMAALQSGPLVQRGALLLGRILLAALFIAGTLQKWAEPEVVEAMLVKKGLPAFFVWPALAFNLAGAISLITGLWIAPMALALALYCMFTSLFHFIPSDPWQMSIFIKNWAIAGGLLVLFGHESNAVKGPAVGKS